MWVDRFQATVLKKQSQNLATERSVFVRLGLVALVDAVAGSNFYLQSPAAFRGKRRFGDWVRRCRRRFAAKAVLNSERASLFGVRRRYQGIVSGKVEGCAIALRGIAVQAEMPAQHLVLLAIDHADEMIVLDRRTYGHRAIGLRRYGGLWRGAETGESPMDVLNELRQVTDRY